MKSGRNAIARTPVRALVKPRRRVGRFLLALVLAACTALPTACGGDDKLPMSAVIYAGGTTGVYYQYAEALRATLAKSVGPLTVVPTSGSVENLNRLASGGTASPQPAADTAFALTAADAADAANTGQAPFDKPIPVRAVARLYDDYIHLVVPADSPVQNVSQLRGLRVSIGGAGSGTQLIAQRILTADGVDWEHALQAVPMGLADSVAALKDHRIDAFFWSGGLPTSGVDDLARTTPFRLLDLAEEATKLRYRFGTSYRTGTIPTGTYADVAKVTTIAVPNLLVTLAGTRDTDVWRFTSALFADKPALAPRVLVARQLDPSIAVYTEPIELHPGAAGYYRSIKPGL
ncbi:MAG: TAXI family TRAP transporter solute-binding subunit [Catenulispora sp.]|nr:TAXI family TRAP transporter solute-binding subunit [Catenulispora sp.]